MNRWLRSILNILVFLPVILWVLFILDFFLDISVQIIPAWQDSMVEMLYVYAFLSIAVMIIGFIFVMRQDRLHKTQKIT